MSRTKSMLAIAAATAMFGAAAKATVTPTGLVLIPHAPGAEVDDPTLAGYQTYDLQVNITGTGSTIGNPSSNGDRWLSTDLRSILSSGTFYLPAKKAGATGDSDLPQSAQWGFAPNRRLEDDTFVTNPGKGQADPVNGFDSSGQTDPTQHGFDSNHVSILGGAQFPPPSTTTGQVFPRTTNSKQTVDVSYGDTGNLMDDYPDGVYTIARLTVTQGANGVVVGRVFSRTNQSVGLSFSFNIGGVVPEPTSVALMGLGVGAVALRRRK